MDDLSPTDRRILQATLTEALLRAQRGGLEALERFLIPLVHRGRLARVKPSFIAKIEETLEEERVRAPPRCLR
jgi:hypothetical protein